MEKMNQAYEKVKMLVGMEVDEDDHEAASSSALQDTNFIDDFNRNCTLSTKQVITLQLQFAETNSWLRLRSAFPLIFFKFFFITKISVVALFSFCVIQQRFYGFAICLAAGLTCTLLSMLVFFHPIKFGITFTLGNLLSLGSTAFLIGPKRQVTMMLDPVRIYATAIYLASIIIALFCALYVHNKLLTLLAILLEFGALIWYSLSYIPFARAMLSKIMVACFDTDF
ncbi:unnamed protein product [Prunus armeniaca]